MTSFADRKAEVSEKVQAAAARRKRKGGMQPTMTPMIDVTFQLLLFFILTCEFRESEGTIPGTLPANGPPISGDPPPQVDPIRIRLIPSTDRLAAKYEMTGVATVISSPRELGELLRARQQQLGTREVPILISPNDQVPWGYVVEAFNQAKRARFDKIGFDRERM